MADTIYWSAPYDYEIRGAPLAGGTVDTLYDAAQDVNLPMGLAIDPVEGRIYWANYGDSTIRGAPLTAGGNVDELYGPADGVSDPFGVAIDPAARQIYWTNGEWSHGRRRRNDPARPARRQRPSRALYGGGARKGPAPLGVVIDQSRRADLLGHMGQPERSGALRSPPAAAAPSGPSTAPPAGDRAASGGASTRPRGRI